MVLPLPHQPVLVYAERPRGVYFFSFKKQTRKIGVEQYCVHCPAEKGFLKIKILFIDSSMAEEGPREPAVL
ncbi:MAG: hypothetical protein GX581_01425 [Syntrophomonadaceae bacterium]|jgi:hypothetical protein|nr:hypothetical protein [Syntrophomonadaceae bacterium]